MMALDTVPRDVVTVTARAPGAGHPECGAISDKQRLIRPGNERPGPGRRWAKPASVSVGPEGPRWYCVETHAIAEAMVVREARQVGFEAFVPLFLDRVPADRKRRLPARDVLRPAFPRFVMVEFDLAGAWRRIASFRGVRRIMGSSAERPSPLSPGEAAWVIAQFGPDGAEVQPREAPRMAPLMADVWVEVVAGPLAGIVGQVNASDGRAVVIQVGGRRVRLPQVAVCEKRMERA